MAKPTSNIVRRSHSDWLDFVDRIRNSTTVNFAESKEDREKRKVAVLKDYNLFARTYLPTLCPVDCAPFHVEFANKVKKTLMEGKSLHGVAEWPREHAKSIHLDVILPMWLKAANLLEGMILMGKNQDDACNLLGDIQAQLMENKLYIHDFGEQFAFGSWEEGDFTTLDGVRFLAIGRDQSPRGARKGEKRPNYGVADDIDDDEIVNNQRRVKQIVKRLLGAFWFALRTKSSVLLMAGNRIHAQSILAHFVGDIKPGMKTREGVFQSKVYALDKKTGKPAWEARYTKHDIEEKMRFAGPTEGRREFFHENHVEGTIFKDAYIQWKPMPKNTWRHYPAIIGYCDPSFENNATSDYKAVRIWSLKGYERHLLKSFVQRTDLNQVFDFMSNFEDECPKGVLPIWYIEEQFFNRPIRQALSEHNRKRRREGRPELHIIVDTRSKENKYTRIVRMEPVYANKNVYHNQDEFHNSDMVEGNNQLKGIEPGYKSPDDAPDADEGAWHYLNPFLPDESWEPVTGRNKRNSSW